MEEGSTADFYVLPEGCISSILSLTSPRDACRSALVSWMFRSAADSDSVWERFLPADYQEIISRSVSPLAFSSKKELYFRLCDNHFLIDDGNKSFTLDKWSGKKCYMMGARELSIVWGDTPAYWSWKPLPESRFSEVAELVGVCWLEINCNMKTRMLSPNTVYVAYLVLKFTETAYGFQFPPAEVSVRFGGGEAVQTAYLDPLGSQRLQLRMQGRPGIFRSRFGFGFGLRPQVSRSGPISEGQVLREREDGWMEIEMGEFFNDRGEDGEVEMSLREVNGGNWKGGLIIQGIEIRAKRE